MLALVKEYFTLEDLLEIKKRLIGTGFIGGKIGGHASGTQYPAQRPLNGLAPGIGNARFFLYRLGHFLFLYSAKRMVETSDGTQNGRGVFRSRPRTQKQNAARRLPGRDQRTISTHAGILWPGTDHRPFQFASGRCFRQRFCRKIRKLFCVNQGTPEERYKNFEIAVRKIFASTMNEDALTYRLQRGMAQQDEQMALLVQRVSGSHHENYFFPDIAGVGLSYNTFVWQKGMDPKAGLLRIVFGLGTRAVNRVENDYPRIVALDAPLVKPFNKPEDMKRFSQNEVDLLNLQKNEFQTVPADELISNMESHLLNLIAIRDAAASEYYRSLGRKTKDAWILTFDELFQNTPFAKTMSKMLKKLEQVYRYPVDIEFTANSDHERQLRINLLQCRPFQTKGHYSRLQLPEKINKNKILFQQEANFMGGSIYQAISRIIYIDPKGYAKLSVSEKHEVARLTGKLNKQIGNREKMPTILLGPGRWGTTTPAMGVPITFSEINNITAIGEIAYQEGSLIPDLSFGTHFFQDMVEMDIFYMAIYPERKDVIFNLAWLEKQSNIFTDLMPDDQKYKSVMKVYDLRTKDLRLLSDIVTQKMICFSNK